MSDLLRPVLDCVDAWYLKYVPAIHATFRSGASDDDLDALERRTGLNLPTAFRTLYQWHDGQNWSVGGVFGLDFMPLREVERSWENWASVRRDHDDWNDASAFESVPAGAVQTAHTMSGWLGFLADGGGNYVGLDFAPGPAGRPGQIITFGRDETEHCVLADSLDDFLREYEARLDDGLFLIGHPDEDGSWEVELLDLAGQGGSGLRGIASAFPDFGAGASEFC